MLRRVSVGLPPLMTDPGKEGCGDLILWRFLDGQGWLAKLVGHP
jgi:hypothetical protein